MEAIYSSETSVDFHWITGVILQNTELFIVTAERISNPVQHRESLQMLSQVIRKMLEEFEDISILVSKVSH
jgi:hypothetical protein